MTSFPSPPLITSAFPGCNFNLIWRLSAGGRPGFTLGFGPFFGFSTSRGKKKKKSFSSPSLCATKREQATAKALLLLLQIDSRWPSKMQSAGDARSPQGAAPRSVALVDTGTPRQRRPEQASACHAEPERTWTSTGAERVREQ